MSAAGALPYPDDEPAAIDEAVTSLDGAAASADGAGLRIDGVAGDIDASWISPAAMISRMRVSALAGHTQTAAGALAAGAGALRTYSGVLHDARARIDVLRTEYEEAEDDHAATRSGIESDHSEQPQAARAALMQADASHHTTMSGITARYDDVMTDVQTAASDAGGELAAQTALASAYLYGDDAIADGMTIPSLDGPPGLFARFFPWFDTDWIPQGLTYHPGSRRYLYTAYNSANTDESLLSIVDPESGKPRHLRLLAPEGSHGPDHAGGVAVNGDDVYVASSEDPPRVYRYSLEELQNHPNNSYVRAEDTHVVDASAYVTIHDGVLYAGSHEVDGPGMLYRYDIDDDGGLDRTGGPIVTPQEVQSVDIHDGQFVFVQSWGRDKPSYVSTQDVDGTGIENLIHSEGNRVLELPNMGEQGTIVDGKLIVNYESGSDEYQIARGDVDPDDLEPRKLVTETPVDALDD